MHAPKSPASFVWGLTLAVVVLAGCSDQGDDDGGTQPPPASNARVDALVPARTFAGDTLRIRGAGFGPSASGAEVRFSDGSGGVVTAALVAGSAWTETDLSVIVPAGAGSGPVLIRRDGADGTGKEFVLVAEVSYANDVTPLFQQYGCMSCHGGTRNLEVTPRSALLRGDSDNGPVVRFRDSASSPLIRMMGPNPPFGGRMPPGGQVSAAHVQTIADWIDQGTRDN